METFAHYWPFVRGIHQSPVDSPRKGTVIWSFDVFFGKLSKLLNKQQLLLIWEVVMLMWWHCNHIILYTWIGLVLPILYSITNCPGNNFFFHSFLPWMNWRLLQSSCTISMTGIWLLLWLFKQSGTKPNLVAKNWLPNLVTILHRLPKLVANISSQFRHRACCRFFCQMATNYSWQHFQNSQIWAVYCSPKWLHPIVITFNTLCPVKFYIQWCVALQWTCWRSYLNH